MRKITAVFDSQPDAQRAQERLLELGVPRENIDLLDNSSYSGQSAGVEHKGMWASIKEMFMPDEDRRTYEESLRRGGFVLVATVEDPDVDPVIECLEASAAVDLDRRAEEWRAQGWTGQEEAFQEEPAQMRSGASAQAPTASEEAIPVVEERLRVGKREVNRGGVRVRSFVVEEPVHEQVRLREERVEVERRPVNQQATPVVSGSPGDLLQERTIEVTETAEEAVVAKDAVVTEEVHVRKHADERVQEVDDTVRRTEVEVEDTRASDENRPVKRDSTPREGRRTP